MNAEVTRMRAWKFDQFGALENLRLGESPVPTPGPGEALVKLEFAALNPADYFLIMGQYPRPGKPPFSVGRDGCGVIEASTSGAFEKGDRVVMLRSDIGVTRDGTLAEYVAVPEESLAPCPENWTPEEAAAAPLVHLTAWRALVIQGEVDATKTVMVTGASGGVGTAAVQQAKALGARVVALSRSAAKREAFESGAPSGTLGSSESGPAPARPARPVIPGERQFRDGDRVRHGRWGDGIVVTSKLTRSDEEITVAFKDPVVGRKTMLASLANLEIIG